MTLIGPDIQALLFDLDGTLLDSVPDLAGAVDAMLEGLGHSPAGVERTAAWVGNGARLLVARALAHADGLAGEGDVPETLLDRAQQDFLRHYEQRLAVHSTLYPAVAETLDKLRLCGFRLAVVTNKPGRFVPPLLAHFGIGRHFQLVLGGDALPEKKPSPEPLLHCARHFGLAPSQCLMVGDSRTDVAAARAAGMQVVCVSYGYNHGGDVADCTPDAVLNSLAELLG